MVRLGDSTIEYNDTFVLVMATKLVAPQLTSEAYCLVTVLNFAITEDGLQEKVMETLFGKEEPEAERKRQDLRVVAVQSRAQLEENEQRVLTMLSSAKGNVLDDDELIDTLANSKIASGRVEERIAEQQKSEQ